MSEEDEILVFDKESGELTRYQPRRRRLHITALTLCLLLVIVISALVVWKGPVEAKVVSISDFQVNQEGSYLKVSFNLLNAENEVISADGTGQLHLYDGQGDLVYNEKFSFSHENFDKHAQSLEYSWRVPKSMLVWKASDAEITVEHVQKGFAVLKLFVNGGETTLTARTPVTFYSIEEAQNIVKEIHRNSVTERLKQWLWQNRYAISEFGGWPAFIPLDLTVMDIAIIGKHAWAVGYLAGIGGYGRILHSPDGGNTWEVQWRSSTWGPDPFKVVFLDEKEGWVAANDAILHTTDGGKTWNTIWRRSGIGNWLRQFQVIDRQHLEGYLSNGRTIYTSDGGKTWQTK